MLHCCCGACSHARRIGGIVVATSTDASDDPIAESRLSAGVAVSRGPQRDVLGRFLLAIGDRDGPIVRITADCPLIDPAIVDETVERFLSVAGLRLREQHPAAHLSRWSGRGGHRRAPRCVRLEREPLELEDREHVTSAIRAQPGRFRQAAVVATRAIWASCAGRSMSLRISSSCARSCAVWVIAATRPVSRRSSPRSAPSRRWRHTTDVVDRSSARVRPALHGSRSSSSSARWSPRTWVRL